MGYTKKAIILFAGLRAVVGFLFNKYDVIAFFTRQPDWIIWWSVVRHFPLGYPYGGLGLIMVPSLWILGLVMTVWSLMIRNGKEAPEK